MTRPRTGQLAVRAAVLLAAAFAGLAWAGNAFATHAPPGTKLWAYEAAFTNSRILQYDIGTDLFEDFCVPPPPVPAASNGRGIAYDQRLNGGKGGLWITRLTGFTGDGLIHKVTLPENGVCKYLGSIKFGDGPGGVDPDDIGALDLDPDTGNLYAAEYISGLLGKDPVSTLFEVDEKTGKILRACNLPTADGFGNDTLALLKNPKIPGVKPGKYLVTDNGEFSTTAQFVIPVSSMGAWTGPAMAPSCKIVATGNTPGGRTGIDFEHVDDDDDDDNNNKNTDDMIATDLVMIYDHNGFPWGQTQATMSAAPSFTLEDITLARACPPNDDTDGDGLTDFNELRLLKLPLIALSIPDFDGNGIPDGNDDRNGNGIADEDEDDDDECPDKDSDGNGVDDEDEDD